jgi:hypothetical protein
LSQTCPSDFTPYQAFDSSSSLEGNFLVGSLLWAQDKVTTLEIVDNNWMNSCKALWTCIRQNQMAIFMFKGHVTKESQVFFKDYKNMYINNVPRLEPFGDY